MGYHEQLPAGSPLWNGKETGLRPEEKLFPVGDNHVQLALMNIWNEEKTKEERIPHSELGRAWIEEGYAEKYRIYAESTPETQVDIHDKDDLSETLAEFDIEALH